MTTDQADPPTTDIWLSPRERVGNAAVGIAVASLAVPILVSAWAPLWFCIAWVCLYASCGTVFLVLAFSKRSPVLEQWWSITAALLFSAQLVSAITWSDDLQHYMTAVVIALCFICFQISAVPFIDIREWRIGLVIISLAVVITALTRLHPLVALSFGPMTYSLSDGVSRVRALKRETEVQLHRVNDMVHRDPLTGLLNRRGLAEALERLSDEPCTVLMVDADRFKHINDSYGYAAGDEVLRSVAKAIEERLGNGFVVGRQGGDEFLAISPGQIEVVETALGTVECSIDWHGQPLRLDVALSGGVTHGTGDESVDRLLSQAGFALRSAKRSDTQINTFAGELRQRFERSLDIAALTSGDTVPDVDHGDLVPVGQVVITNDNVVGVEILIRWQRGDGTQLGPDEFLPLAQQIGAMPAINERMVEHAVAFAARFNNLPAAPFVSANVTAAHLTAPGFAQRLHDLLEHHRVPASRIMIEITEPVSALSADWVTATADLRRVGVKLALDDFGTGASSIERLPALPITHLKLDRSMIQAISSPFGEVARGIARFADLSQIALVATGIETLDELESVRALGVEIFQGFLFGTPTELDEVERYVISRLPSAMRRSNHD